MNTWDEICGERGLYDKCEAVVHPHVDKEEAIFFRCRDGGTTEYEYLNLLHALVIADKPRDVLELGTYTGFGTLALAHGLGMNGIGHLTTVDIDECKDARHMIWEESLEKVVTFEKMEALHLCRDRSRKWDFVFVDSGDQRSEECRALIDGGNLLPHSLVCFHDASPLRSGPSTNRKEVEFLASIPRTIRLWKSRGFEIFQMP